MKRKELKVGTYNILHGANYPKKRETGVEEIDLSLAANAIRSLDLDFCGLNEVRNQENVEGLCNQARVIAEQLGYHYVFARAIDYMGGEYGNAFVSRYPILSCQLVPLVFPKEERIKGKYYEDRVLLVAEIKIENTVVKVIATHFGLSEGEQQLAIDTIQPLVKDCRTPLFVMGDFNLMPDTTLCESLCGLLTDTAIKGEGSLLSFSSFDPHMKIDYIFTNDLVETSRAFVPEINTSDHRPYVAYCAIDIE